MFKATEYSIADEAIEETGRSEHYSGATPEEATAHCLYTHSLHNRDAKLGPSGRVVHCAHNGKEVAYSIKPRPE